MRGALKIVLFRRRAIHFTCSCLLLFLSKSSFCQVVDVVAIYDGDTFTANIPGWPDIVGKRIGVRVKGVDTPEIRGAKCAKERKLARDAKQFTVTALRGAKVVELVDVERDKYFRLLATVLLDGNRLDELLIKEGLGYEYKGKTKRDWCGSSVGE